MEHRKTTYQKRPLIRPMRVVSNSAISDQPSKSDMWGRVAYCLLLALFVLCSIVMPAFPAADGQAELKLNEAQLKLLGKSKKDAAKHLTFDQKAQEFVFAETPAQSTVGQSIKAGQKEGAYEVSLPKNGKSGIELTDTTNKISIKLVPKFPTGAARQVEDHIAYPLGGKNYLAYTFKANGLKEDIIVSEFTQDTLSYEFDLQLPGSLEARLETDGSIGVYSGDPALFGSITSASDEDTRKLELARKNSAKNYRMFTIPAPIIKQTGSSEEIKTAQFKLEGTKLTLTATDLKNLSYPIAIDPSFVVTSFNDFKQGTADDNIEIDETNGQLVRSRLSGATVTSWATEGTGLTGRSYHATVISNGFLYVIAGCTAVVSGSGICTSLTGNVQKASVSSAGVLGNWSNVSVDVTPRFQHTAVAYNGYIYVITGCGDINCNGAQTLERGKINSTGDITSWTTVSAPGAVARAASVVYKGKIYNVGGNASSNSLATVYMTTINPDMSLQPWTSTTSMPSVLSNLGVAVYNDFIYAGGGCNSASECSSVTNAIYYAHINTTTGAIETWAATSSFATPRQALSMAIGNGYMYIGGGVDIEVAPTVFNDVQFAPVLSNGQLGSFTATTGFTNTRLAATMTYYNNKIYIAGGQTLSALRSDSQTATIAAAGTTSAWTQDGGTSFATARMNHSVAVYNGYVYLAGGATATALSDVQYAPINDDGSIGTWNTTTALPATELAQAGRERFAMIGYEGFLFVVGGISASLVSGTIVHTDVVYAPTNTDGTIGTWLDAGNSFTNGRYDLDATIYNGKLYISGGYNGTTTYSDIQYATVNYDGTIGAFASTTTNSGVALYGHSLVSYGGKMYIAGGNSNSRNIYSADIQNSGDITGSWTTYSDVLPAVSMYRTKFIIYRGIGFLYAQDTYTTGVWSAVITSTGGFGNFSSATSMNTAVGRTGTAFYNGYIFVFGGCTSNSGSPLYTCLTYSNVVQSTKIYNDEAGGLSAMASASSLLSPRQRHASIYYGGRIWVMGGCSTAACDAANILDTTEYATVNANGSLSAWTAGPNLLTARAAMPYALVGEYVYMISGSVSAGTTTSVEYAKLNSDGTFSDNSCGTSVTWCTTTAYPNAVAISSATVYNGYIYVGPGGGAATKVRYAKPNTNGTISSWIDGTDFPEARYWGPALTAYNGYLYAAGGCTTSSCVDLFIANNRNTVLSAQINADGSIGAWKYITSFHGQRRATRLEAHNGYMYLIRGDTPGTNNPILNQFAPILPNGNLGAWQKTTSGTFAVAHGTLIVNDRLYRLGGNGDMSVVQYYSFLSLTRKGTYTKRINLDGSAVANKYLIKGSGIGLRLKLMQAADASSAFTSNSLSGTIYAYPFLGSLVKQERQYQELQFTFDDTQSAVFPDTLSNAATLTDYELFYTATPAKRLRGGKTFTNEQPRGLEINPN